MSEQYAIPATTCRYPGCEDLSERPSGKPGRPQEYCADPGHDRVNGVVSNMPEFQKAFSCKAGQPMVKANVCRVW